MEVDDTKLSLELRIRTSWGCVGIYLVAIALCVALLAMEAVSISSSRAEEETLIVRIVTEVLVNLILTCEIVLGMWASSGFKRYIQRRTNQVDVVVLIVSLLFLIIADIESLHDRARSDRVQIADAVLLVVRYGVQILRLAMFIQRSKQASKYLSQGDVQFEDLALDGESYSIDQGSTA